MLNIRKLKCQPFCSRHNVSLLNEWHRAARYRAKQTADRDRTRGPAGAALAGPASTGAGRTLAARAGRRPFLASSSVCVDGAARVKVGLSSCSPSGRQGNEELSGENERDQARDIGRYGNGRSASCPPQRRSRAAPPPPRPPAPGVAHAWSERKRPGKQVSRPAAGSARAQGAVQARSPGGGQRGRRGDRPPHGALGKRLPAPCRGPAPGCLERPTRPRP